MKQKAFEACLALIEQEGWKGFSFARAAAYSDLPLSLFQEHFSSPISIMVELFRSIDRKVLETVDPSFEGSIKEKLFEIFMARFEAAQPYKAVFQSFWKDWPDVLPNTPILACQAIASMGWMMEAVGLSQQGLPGLLRVQGLTGLYFLTLRTWLTDDSPDLGKTMAFLDKSLTQLEGVAAFLDTL